VLYGAVHYIGVSSRHRSDGKGLVGSEPRIAGGRHSGAVGSAYGVDIERDKEIALGTEVAAQYQIECARDRGGLVIEQRRHAQTPSRIERAHVALLA
jgi:hypothetical protein